MEVLARLLEKFAPAIFVLLWSTGFIGAKLGLPHVEPFTFLSLRMLIVVAILAPVVFFFVKKRTTPALFMHSMIVGILVHAVYLGGVFFAISRGMSAGVASLVVALQPLLTVFIARAMLGERMTARQVTGLIVALAGVILVLSPRIFGGTALHGLSWVTLSAVTASVIGISFGSVYQKRFATGIDIRVATLAQYLGSLIPLGLLSLLTETRQVEWTLELVIAMAWLVIVLSIGAVSLLMFLIRRDSAGSTATLFYLVPVFTALIAWVMFGETLQPVQFAGMALVISAIAYGMKKPASRPAVRS
ncbi:MAG: DMT family transporter [Nitratireductor sp.]|nr:DMT family transporter [Nitratireductor sp.]MCC0019976.1 DMT family transporter [Nitratireductor sp.]